ncbi:caspase family protein [Lewinella cohaerens]|uniref:nSTAND1 domain-containing NTPase n=1 Tax=Lewinella cohaerens TaxID=70995 RepID=UPI00036F1D24|nr:caspase family protein [Lewinella cohaerens]
MQNTGNTIQLPFTTSHAFIIGINDYEHLTPLNTAVNDAKVLAERLEKEHGYQVHPPLLNANKENLLTFLKETIPQKVGEKDRVLFYFAGHGIALDSDLNPKGYLVPADAKPQEIDSLVAMDVLYQMIVDLPCKHGLIIMDCCFSGAFKWSTGYRDVLFDLPSILYEERYSQYVKHPAWQVITSSASDEKALDVLVENSLGLRSKEGSEHSPFALALLEGLDGSADRIPSGGGDGVITATELFAFLRDRVEEQTNQDGKNQSPSFFSLDKHEKGEYIFFHPRHRLNLPPIPRRNPFMGLKSYKEADASLFFGREKAIKALEAYCKPSAFLVISGESGSGKSSLVRAGLFPVLREQEWQILPVIQPGETPLATLKASSKKFKERLANNTPTVLYIDQYEELITKCKIPEERLGFEKKLKRLLLKFKHLMVIVSVRKDLEPALAEGPLKNRWQQCRYETPALTTEEVREIIVKPAREEVLFFEPKGLIDSLVTEVDKTSGALPLLSFTLSELYEAYIQSGRTDRSLTEEDYQKKGGLFSGLRTWGNDLYDNLDETHQKSMRKLLLRMIVVEKGVFSCRRIYTDELIYADPQESERTLDIAQRLVTAHLLATGITEQGQRFFEPAYGHLLHIWGRLREWITIKGEEKIIQRYKLRHAVENYNKQQTTAPQKARGLLWDNNPQLEVLKIECQAGNHGFNKQEEAFIQTSLKRKSIRRASTWGALIIVPLIAIGAWYYLLGREQLFKAVDATQKQRIDNLNHEKQELTAQIDSIEGLRKKALNLVIARELTTRSALARRARPIVAFRLAEHSLKMDSNSMLAKIALLKAFYANIENASRPAVAFDQDNSQQHSTLFLNKLHSGRYTPEQFNVEEEIKNRLFTLISGKHTSIDSLFYSESSKTLALKYRDNDSFSVWEFDNTWNLRGIFPCSIVIRSQDNLVIKQEKGTQITLNTCTPFSGEQLFSGNNKTYQSFDPVNFEIEVLSENRLKNGIKITNRSSFESVELIGHQHPILSIAISPDGQSILTCSKQELKLWDWKGYNYLSFPKGGKADFSPDGDFILRFPSLPKIEPPEKHNTPVDLEIYPFSAKTLCNWANANGVPKLSEADQAKFRASELK